VILARVILEQGKHSTRDGVERGCLDQAARYLDHASREVDSVVDELGMDTEWWVASEP
jgi:hypothetical protein